MLTGCIGTILGDNLFFFLGRKHSKSMLRRHPSWKERIERAHRLVERFQTFLILIYRYLYGLRSVIPFALGMTPVPSARFVAVSAAGAVVWAIIVAGGGFFFGNALELIIEKVKRYELAFFGILAGIGLIIWLVLYFRRTKSKPSDAAALNTVVTCASHCDMDRVLKPVPAINKSSNYDGVEYQSDIKKEVGSHAERPHSLE